MPDQPNTQPNTRYANLRDSFTALREFIIVGAMLGLLFVPGRVRGILEDAGIKSLAGVEFDAKTLRESESEVAKAKVQVEELEQQLTMAQTQLNKIAQSSGNRANPAFGTVSKLLAGAQRLAIEAETNLDRSTEKNTELLRRHGLRPQDIRIKLPQEQPTQQTLLIPQVQQAEQPLISPEQLFQR